MQTSQPNFICFPICSYCEYEQYGQNGCGQPVFARIFFLSFNFAFNMLLIPILVSIIVDGYVETKELEGSKVTRKFISRLTEEWSKIDPEAKGEISYYQFWNFCPVFMKLYEEGKSLRDINVAPFATDKSDFLEKVKV